MKLIKPSFEILSIMSDDYFDDDPLQLIELAGRTCYKSENKISENSARDFIAKILKRGHESVIEHSAMTVKFICDRGVSHELIRHRLCSFSQESTRYVSSITKNKFIVTSEEDVIDKYLNGFSMKKISNMSNGLFTEWEVYKILDKNDINRRSIGNTGLIYDDFFSKIDTPEKAYLLGFILADGSIRSNGNQITISQDKEYSWYIWRMLKNLVKPLLNRSNDKSCHSISFCSDKIVKDLFNIGIKPRKSFDMTKEDAELLWDSISSDALIPSFIRGILDGDGGVRFFKQKNKGETDSCNINWSGNKFILKKISNWINNTYGYTSTVKNESNNGNNFSRLRVTNPSIGDRLVKDMMSTFIFPYGHPAKTSRMIERIGGTYPIDSWGDDKFKIIIPTWFDMSDISSWVWLESMDESEEKYTKLSELGWTPQQARSILPNSTKTEIIMTTNFREWRHIFKLRCSKVAHPQMKEIMVPLLQRCKRLIPVIFDDIKVEE
jgi:thymidylate synthase ThyX